MTEENEVVLDEESAARLVRRIKDGIRDEIRADHEDESQELAEELRVQQARIQEKKQREASEKADRERDELVVGAVKEADQNVQNLSMLLEGIGRAEWAEDEKEVEKQPKPEKPELPNPTRNLFDPELGFSRRTRSKQKELER